MILIFPIIGFRLDSDGGWVWVGGWLWVGGGEWAEIMYSAMIRNSLDEVTLKSARGNFDVDSVESIQ